MTSKDPAAVALGSKKSPAKAAAAKINGAKGGRPPVTDYFFLEQSANAHGRWQCYTLKESEVFDRAHNQSIARGECYLDKIPGLTREYLADGDFSHFSREYSNKERFTVAIEELAHDCRTFKYWPATAVGARNFIKFASEVGLGDKAKALARVFTA